MWVMAHITQLIWGMEVTMDGTWAHIIRLGITLTVILLTAIMAIRTAIIGAAIMDVDIIRITTIPIIMEAVTNTDRRDITIRTVRIIVA